MIGLTVCVEFADLLAVTLPYNAGHFERVVVVTKATDQETLDLVDDTPNAVAFMTDAFTRDGASFNKGLAIEEAIDLVATFRDVGRESIGWLCSFDADILMPPELPVPELAEDTLYAPWRRILPEKERWAEFTDPATWSQLERYEETWEFAGACLLFSSRAPHLRDKRHWFGTAWKHAGGYDSQFFGEWPKAKRCRMDWDILHLGEHGQNWYGRTTPMLDGSMPENAEERAAAVAAIEPNRQIHKYALERVDGKRDWFAR